MHKGQMVIVILCNNNSKNIGKVYQFKRNLILKNKQINKTVRSIVKTAVKELQPEMLSEFCLCTTFRNCSCFYVFHYREIGMIMLSAIKVYSTNV